MKTRFDTIEQLWTLCPQLKNIMAGNGSPGASGKLHLTRGTSTANNLLIIANAISDLEAKNTLETGMAFGASSLAFLAAKNTGTAEGVHIAIDPFQHRHYDDCGLVAVKTAGLGQAFEFKSGYSSIELGKLLETGRRFDLIYIDGSHLFEDAFVDAYFAARLLRDGGVMLFDDCADRHIAKVLAFLRSNLQKSLCEVDASRWRADHGKNWRYQIARRIGRAQLVAFQRRADPQRDYGSELLAF